MEVSALREGEDTLTLGLLRGLVERPEDAPLIDRDLHKHTTRSGSRRQQMCLWSYKDA